MLRETYRENEAWWLCDPVCLKPLCNTTFLGDPSTTEDLWFFAAPQDLRQESQL